MGKEQDYERNAREALEVARNTVDVSIRAHWLAIADHWLDLAKAEKDEAWRVRAKPAAPS